MPDNRKGFASALHIRGLRQRWMFSAVLPILLLLVLAVALFSVGVQEYYYNAMRSGLESRARIAAETFTVFGSAGTIPCIVVTSTGSTLVMVALSMSLRT